MQIVQWLFRMPSRGQPALTTNSCSKRILTIEEEEEDEGEVETSREIKLKKVNVTCKDSFTVLLTRTNSRTCLFSTLNLKSIRDFYVRRDCLHPVGEEEDGGRMGHTAEPVLVGSKVLPLCDATSSASQVTDYSSDGSVKKKKRATSRMKELVRWAAAVKSDRGANGRWKVLNFRSKGAHKAPYDEKSSSSSRISVRWNAGSYSSSSSTLNSPFSLSSSSCALARQHSDECSNRGTCTSPKPDDYVRIGHWITTDSDFVVLEL